MSLIRNRTEHCVPDLSTDLLHLSECFSSGKPSMADVLKLSTLMSQFSSKTSLSSQIQWSKLLLVFSERFTSGKVNKHDLFDLSELLSFISSHSSLRLKHGIYSYA